MNNNYGEYVVPSYGSDNTDGFVSGQAPIPIGISAVEMSAYSDFRIPLPRSVCDPRGSGFATAESVYTGQHFKLGKYGHYEEEVVSTRSKARSSSSMFVYGDPTSPSTTEKMYFSESKDAIELRWNNILNAIPHASVKFFADHQYWVVTVHYPSLVELRVFLCFRPEFIQDKSPRCSVDILYHHGDRAEFMRIEHSLRAQSLGLEPASSSGNPLTYTVEPVGDDSEDFGFLNMEAIQSHHAALVSQLVELPVPARAEALQTLYGASTVADSAVSLVSANIVETLLSLFRSSSPRCEVIDGQIKPCALLILYNLFQAGSGSVVEKCSGESGSDIRAFIKSMSTASLCPLTKVVEACRALKEKIIWDDADGLTPAAGAGVELRGGITGIKRSYSAKPVLHSV